MPNFSTPGGATSLAANWSIEALVRQALVQQTLSPEAAAAIAARSARGGLSAREQCLIDLLKDALAAHCIHLVSLDGDGSPGRRPRPSG